MWNSQFDAFEWKTDFQTQFIYNVSRTIRMWMLCLCCAWPHGGHIVITWLRKFCVFFIFVCWCWSPASQCENDNTSVRDFCALPSYSTSPACTYNPAVPQNICWEENVKFVKSIITEFFVSTVHTASEAVDNYFFHFFFNTKKALARFGEKKILKDIALCKIFFQLQRHQWKNPNF